MYCVLDTGGAINVLIVACSWYWYGEVLQVYSLNLLVYKSFKLTWL